MIGSPFCKMLSHELNSAQKAILDSTVSDAMGVYYQEIAFDELDMLIGRLQGITSFKALNALKTLSTTEKKILERVFSIIVDWQGIEKYELIEAIINEFAGKEERNSSN